jgi:hypothetical protein
MCGSYTLAVFIPVMPELFARHVFYMSFNIAATLCVYRSYALFSKTPPYRNTLPLPPTTYINLEIISSPVVSSYFVGIYFSFDILVLQYEFRVQHVRLIEIQFVTR